MPKRDFQAELLTGRYVIQTDADNVDAVLLRLSDLGFKWRFKITKGDDVYTRLVGETGDGPWAIRYSSIEKSLRIGTVSRYTRDGYSFIDPEEFLGIDPITVDLDGVLEGL